ncbi:hypothetical protein PENTCL1PPCAC_913, partial [Pristionchus entomophagus]
NIFFSILSVKTLTALRGKVSGVKRKSLSIETSYFWSCFCIFVSQFLNLILVITLTTVSLMGNASKGNQLVSIVLQIMPFTADLFSIGPAL